MWSTARAEIKELMRLTWEVATFDATVAANPRLHPTQQARDKRQAMQERRLELMEKYELTDGWASRV